MLVFKLFLRLYTALYRLSAGKVGGTMRGFKVLLLTTTGRKSGKARTVPLGYFERQGGYVIIGSNGGQHRHPAWYHNIKSHPETTVQILDKVFPAKAEVLTGDARSQAWEQVVTESPLYANYQKNTRREIPLVLLHPDQ